jgi:hypothetical protein
LLLPEVAAADSTWAAAVVAADSKLERHTPSRPGFLIRLLSALAEPDRPAQVRTV